MSIEEIHKLFLASNGISTDSRKIWDGCIYLALKGERFDGNEFAVQSLEQGARYAIVDSGDLSDSRLIKVDDGLSALQELAAYHRAYCGWPTLGITGSNGKTTTKELIGAVLSTKFKILITEGNLNNHIGVPLTLLKGNRSHDIAVIEMGASHQGDIKELCDIANPDLGLITNIGKAHLEGMGGLEGVLKTKGELFDHILHNDGKLLLNMSQERLVKQFEGKQHLSFGTSSDCSIHGKAMSTSGHLSVSWKRREINNWNSIQTNLVGNYNLDNVLAAITVGVEFGISDDDINAAIESYVPTNNRSEYVESGSNRIIWDAYNANPSSMESALQNIESVNADRIVLILGEMKEVGASSKQEHLDLIANATKLNPISLYLVGESFAEQGSHQTDQFSQVSELIEHLKQHPITNSLVLVKGSRSNQLEKLKEVL